MQTDPGNHVTAKFRSHRGPFPTTSPFGPRTAEPVGSVNLSPDSSQRDGQTAPVKWTSPHRPSAHMRYLARCSGPPILPVMRYLLFECPAE